MHSGGFCADLCAGSLRVGCLGGVVSVATIRPFFYFDARPQRTLGSLVLWPSLGEQRYDCSAMNVNYIICRIIVAVLLATTRSSHRSDLPRARISWPDPSPQSTSLSSSTAMTSDHDLVKATSKHMSPSLLFDVPLLRPLLHDICLLLCQSCCKGVFGLVHGGAPMF
jgi:hypothetical protein